MSCMAPLERQDPLVSLGTGDTTSSPYKDLTVAWIDSENTKKSFEYIQEMNTISTFLNPFARINVEQAFKGINDIFEKNFKKAIKVSKIDDGKSLKVDLIVLLDIFAEPGNTSLKTQGQNTKVEVSAIFLTLDQKQIEVLNGKGERKVAAFSFNVEEAANEAGKNLESALFRSEKLVAYSRGGLDAVAALGSGSKVPQLSRTIPASDVDRLPTTTVKPKKNAYAVVIGIEQYQQQLPKADFAGHDAKIVSEYLIKGMGYPQENVVVLVGEQATKSGLEKYIESWLPNHVEKGNSVFVYFSGHGAPNPKTGDAYLVPYDGDPVFVDKTAYPLKRLYEQLGNLPAEEVVVVLDSCFSGAGGRSVIAQGVRPLVLSMENPILAKGRTMVLSASAGAQISSTYETKGHGLLTYFFLKGLQGDADTNKDGTIEVGELFDYLKPQVERVARREFNNEQTPQLLGSPEILKRGVRLVELR